MKIVIAPDSFKECLTALEVAQQIELGFTTVFPQAEFIKVPVADGGEGTVQALLDATGGDAIKVSVHGPLGIPVTASYGLIEQDGQPTAVIEMAAASGLDLVPLEKRNPLITSSYGTGELINDALNRGVRRFILGLGGSATNDGGAGMAQALGFGFYDAKGLPLAPGGEVLSALCHVDTTNVHPALSQASFQVACDVDNPLCGPQGASTIFGPQKGASAAMVTTLELALQHYGDVVTQHGFGDERQTPGAGAAGGMGFGALTLLNASLKPGIDIVIDTVKLEEKLKGASLVITGEGRLDSQTLRGKTPMGVAKCAAKHQIPLIGIAGSVSSDANVLLEHGFSALFSITPGASDLRPLLNNAADNLKATSVNIAAALRISL
ncbi:glycerate kinase [Ferrimonas aestuarii]|uniref:Glycerate kinase n=1 Tax=Ferrimonas aestuarii TaxID=2569539 RepID=A0A4U1BQX1_9GAMM|nr:glycerate kinase [Ferrimonas aestuarii]TKB56548.1 glycerate kinase [Ferrimonas aestuarii]